MAADEFGERFGIPLPADRDFETVAGIVLDRLGHIPKLGEKLKIGAVVIEVLDLDGFRIDKLLVSENEARQNVA